MGQLIIPTDREVNGPWFIDSDSIESLDQTVSIIESKLEEAYNKLLEKEVEERFSEFRMDDEAVTPEQVKRAIEKTYTFKKHEKTAIITGRKGEQIVDKALLLLLKDSKLDNIEPVEFSFMLQKGPCEFSIEVSARYFRGDLKTRTKVADDDILSDVNYELTKWIEKNKPNVAMQKWSSWFPWATPFLLFVLFFYITSFF